MAIHFIKQITYKNGSKIKHQRNKSITVTCQGSDDNTSSVYLNFANALFPKKAKLRSDRFIQQRMHGVLFSQVILTTQGALALMKGLNDYFFKIHPKFSKFTMEDWEKFTKKNIEDAENIAKDFKSKNLPAKPKKKVKSKKK